MTWLSGSNQLVLLVAGAGGTKQMIDLPAAQERTERNPSSRDLGKGLNQVVELLNHWTK